MTNDSISWWRTEFGQATIDVVSEAIRNERIGQGILTSAFEQDFAKQLGVKYALAVTSGSVALYLGLLAKGVGRDDEVIVPDRTWVASAHAPYMLGAKPVLVDVVADRPVVDAQQIEKAITAKTKAIMPVHLNGRECDMAQIMAIAKRHNLVVIEDACQALFSKHRDGAFMGTLGHAGCYSLGTTKLISSGQGGMIVTNDDEYYEKLKLVKNHGVVDQFTDRWNQFGFNFKFTDIQAAMVHQHLKTAAGRIEHVREVHRMYQKGLERLDYIKLLPFAGEHELPLYADAVTPYREKFINYMRDNNVQCRPFPPSLHTTDYLNSGSTFPNSAHFNAQGLYLPAGPSQPLDKVARVIELVKKFR